MSLKAIWAAIMREPLAQIGLAIMLVLVLMAIMAPVLMPYHPTEILRGTDGRVKIFLPPSGEHFFGTTALGRDVFSQILLGTRTALIVGLWAAIMATAIGTFLGLAAGYLGDRTDQLISRLVEIVYSIPFEPFAIILLALIRPNIWTIVLAITLIMWRQPTRVIRNQVLALRGSAFIKAAQVSGGTKRWIMLRHLLPLVLPIALVYVPVGFGNAILAEAAISFLGFGDPRAISWGGMLRTAFEAGAFDGGWWWIIAPGFFITLATAAMFFVTRPFEELVNPRLRGD